MTDQSTSERLSIVPVANERDRNAFERKRLQDVADAMLRLTYGEFMEMAQDLHADGHTIDQTAAEVAAVLHRYATRVKADTKVN
jgi:hypothetical protein